MAVGSRRARAGFLNLPQQWFVWCAVGAVSIGAVLVGRDVCQRLEGPESRVVDLTDDSTDVVVASWACAYCTFAPAARRCSSRAACGQPRSKVAAAAATTMARSRSRPPHEQDSRDAEVRSVAPRAAADQARARRRGAPLALARALEARAAGDEDGPAPALRLRAPPAAEEPPPARLELRAASRSCRKRAARLRARAAPVRRPARVAPARHVVVRVRTSRR